MSEGQKDPGTALAPIVPPDDKAIEQLRKKGQKDSALVKEAKKVRAMIEEMEWGTGSSAVKGRNFSRGTQYALAEFCVITQANPLIHVDILGGKPYHNAQYWADRINNDERFHHYEQRELGPDYEKALRDRAQRLKAMAGELEEAGMKDKAVLRRNEAMDCELEADSIATDRAKWSPKPGSKSVIETTIWRYVNTAPMDKIKSGEITNLDPYLIRVVECNWAGANDSDPVGNKYPSLTARTRSLRRCAVKAFSAWMGQYDRQIKKAEDAIEAEWVQISNDEVDEAKALPGPDEPQAVSVGNGEPEMASREGAQELPLYGEPVEGLNVVAPEPEEAPPSQEAPEPEEEGEAFDKSDAHKRLFATLHDAGIEEKDRKKWAAEHHLPKSTKDWGKEEYDQAQDILMTPWVQRVEEGCKAIGADLGDLSLKVLGQDHPVYLKHYQEIAAYIDDQLAEEDL